jgi:DNA-binding response OmpR family regulator
VKNIALIEDDEHLAQTILEYLKTKGYEVVHYTSGLEFVDVAKLSEINLILLDIFVHDINGFEVLKYLKSVDSKVPVFVVSGMLEIDFIEKAFHLGVKDYLKKPVHLKELLLRIERFLDTDDIIKLNEDLSYDKVNGILIKQTEKIQLTPKLKEILNLFTQYPNEVITYDFLIASIWSTNDITTNTIATYIRDLKSLINPVKIVNISKVGYKLIF